MLKELNRDEKVRKEQTFSPPGRSLTPPPPVDRHRHHTPAHHDEDSRNSIASDDKVPGSNFVPFAMALGASKGDHHAVGNKTPASPVAPVNNQNSKERKKGRIDVKDVFNNDDDDDTAANSKKRKLVPIGE